MGGVDLQLQASQKPVKKESPYLRRCYASMERRDPKVGWFEGLVLTLPFLSCVTLDEILNLSGPVSFSLKERKSPGL